MIFWFTGLSGAGKTTICESMADHLKNRGLRVEHLDGDKMRERFPGTGFSKEDRDSKCRRIGYIASLLESHEVIVLASFISPYRETRDAIRDMCEEFVEIHVSTPLSKCEERDVKGLYARVRSGEIKNFTGIDDPYEEPENPELELLTHTETIEQSLNKILEHLTKEKYI